MPDGDKEGARREAYRKIRHDCPCGRILRGNLATSHLRTCETNLKVDGWPLDSGMKQALLHEYSGRRQVPRYSQIVRGVERKLGQLYLARRAAGDKTALPWRDYRDLVWALADRADVYGNVVANWSDPYAAPPTFDEWILEEGNHGRA